MKKHLLILLVLSICIFALNACACDHDWEDADCETPKTCSKCDETEGEPLEHEWEAATCKAPETCALCGETKGEALEHQWQDADCENPKTCSLCGDTEGDALGHQWQDATCQNPQTCTVCAATEGEALAHTPGDWTEIGKNIVDATVVWQQTCSECGSVIAEETDPLYSFAENYLYLFNPTNFMERFSKIAEENGAAFTYEITDVSGALQIVIDYNSITALVQVFNGSESLTIDEAEDESIYAISLTVYGEEDATLLYNCFMMACDPLMDAAGASASLQEILDDHADTVDAGGYITYYTESGLTYEYATFGADDLGIGTALTMLNIYAVG